MGAKSDRKKAERDAKYRQLVARRNETLAKAVSMDNSCAAFGVPSSSGPLREKVEKLGRKIAEAQAKARPSKKQVAKLTKAVKPPTLSELCEREAYRLQRQSEVAMYPDARRGAAQLAARYAEAATITKSLMPTLDERRAVVDFALGLSVLNELREPLLSWDSEWVTTTKRAR